MNKVKKFSLGILISVLLVVCAVVAYKFYVKTKDTIALKPLVAQLKTFSEKQTDCKSEDECSTAEATILVLDKQDRWISDIVNREIWKLMVANDKPYPTKNFQHQLKAQLKLDVKPDVEDHSDADSSDADISIWSTQSASAEITGQTDDGRFLVISISSESYNSGAAHGVEGTRLLNFDRVNKRLIQLKDVLVSPEAPLKNKRLNALFYPNYVELSKSEEDSSLKDYEEMWPFHLSDNWTLTETGLVMQYNEYEIASYSQGMPSFEVKYGDLRGVLKSEYMLKVKPTNPNGKFCPCSAS